MTPVQRRAFIAIDEWLGILWLTYLWRAEDPLFWWMLPIWALAVYGFGYVPHWWAEARGE